ncbi:two-component system phosphate regulon sensor histidine kinase PhoR [Mucilaginibacter gracilis]|uniref:histidine kinase n=1 Tax=Mucilaginibacter gracilis TaxID=423350 RepID=A0A495IV66_9SPHI|nr:HAMP domain-containing sensor histidine kinase [Mucilaginibacter gracilis]RKR80645.1 two-component system phosphate regulon sensor histidine kinase PhoR [Mucilaginibacter gracilis]
MKKKNISLITGLMAVALFGVMAMQFYFLRQSYSLQSSLFDHSVNEALNNVVDRISKQDANKFLIDKSKYPNQLIAQHPAYLPKQKTFILKYSRTIHHSMHAATSAGTQNTQHSLTRAQRIANLKDSVKHLIEERKLDYALDQMSGSINLQVRVEEYTDETGVVRQNFIPQITAKPVDPRQFLRTNGKLHKYIDTTQIVYLDPQFGKQIISVPNLNPLWVKEQARKRKAQQLKQVQHLLQIETADTPNNTTLPEKSGGVIENLVREYQRANEPLKERINLLALDTILRTELHNQGIDLPFSYDVAKLDNDSLIFAKAWDTKGDVPVFLVGNSYQKAIFSSAVNDPGRLRVSFPQKNSLILSHMASTMATTGGLIVVLIFCFGYTIYSIVKQKKISEMKTDFINNMTHEFKTPVSTIMIASEALKDVEIAGDKSRVAKLANIIYEENVRLGSHIERVLNIARIEKNDFKLDIKRVDVNETITTVLDSMLLKLQKHEVNLNLNLNDQEMVIKADELHFSNVLYNLIDNAIKYSTETPEITISTLSKGGQAVIRVADKGIGMSTDQQVKIFEQFYRIPTGNLHDVKGFGLGLSYVNTIVKRLNGTISVKSEREKGSEFEMRFDEISQGKSK